LSYLIKFSLNYYMHQPSIGSQNVKILHFQILSHICPQLRYATAESWSLKVEIQIFYFFNQILTSTRICNSRALVTEMQKLCILSYLIKFALNHVMQHRRLGCQNVKILNFELYNQIWLQVGYATVEPLLPKFLNYILWVI